MYMSLQFPVLTQLQVPVHILSQTLMCIQFPMYTQIQTLMYIQFPMYTQIQTLMYILAPVYIPVPVQAVVQRSSCPQTGMNMSVQPVLLLPVRSQLQPLVRSFPLLQI